MKSPEDHSITDEEARRLAKGLVVLFRSPLKLMGNADLEKPITIADMIRMGGTILNGLNAAKGDGNLKEQNREFISTVCELIYLPDAMEEFLYNLIKERGETAGDITDAILQVEDQMSGRNAARRFFHKAIAEVLPKARRGRPTEFNPTTDPDRFLSLSSQLNRVCDNFLRLREQFPRKSNMELMDFLKSEDPKAADFVRKHGEFISETLSDFDFRDLKTHETRVRRLADAIAGKELFDWSFKYAVQRGGEFRRSKGIDLEE